MPWTYGAVHFQEVAFVFYNTMGLGYPQNLNPNPLGGPERPKYLKLALQMSRSWISFINYGDPNHNLGSKSRLSHISNKLVSVSILRSKVRMIPADNARAVEAETWPAYSLDQPQNFVFEQNITSHPEPDYYRAAGINYIGELIQARNGGNCSGLVVCGDSADD